MTHPLYYLGIIEGALHQKGEDFFSVKVWHALRMLSEHLGAPTILPANLPLNKPVQQAIERGIAMAEEAALHDKKPRWQDWQIDILKKMKANGESAEAIAIAVEKTPSQVNSKWFMIKQDVEAEK